MPFNPFARHIRYESNPKPNPFSAKVKYQSEKPKPDPLVGFKFPQIKSFLKPKTEKSPYQSQKDALEKTWNKMYKPGTKTEMGRGWGE